MDGDRGFLNGRSNRSSHPGVLRLDDTAAPPEIPVIPVQGLIPTGSGSGCGLGIILDFDVCVI